jgi:hypothetical protein
MEHDIPRRVLVATREYLAGFEETALETFLGDVARPMEERTLIANPLPCLRHLDRIASVAAGDGSEIIRLLANSRDGLRWGQTYTEEDFSRDFIENYGWMELVGTRGHFVNEEIAAGFLVLGPHLHYPDHHHAAEEIYIPLTGDTAWRKDDGPYVEHRAGTVIHHPSNVNHAMKTGSEPLLALYLWRGGPLAARSVVTGKAERT